MDRACFNEIVSLLLPYMDVVETRQAILQTAWYGSPLLYQVQWTGNAHTFTVLAIRTAIDFGEIEKDVPAVLALLEGLRPQVGYEVQAKINDIIIRCFQSSQSSLPVSNPPQLPLPSNEAGKDHLFISYSSSDRAAFVDRLAKDLTVNNYFIWVDNLGPQYNGIVAGKSWKQELADALNRTKLVIFVITPDSIRSQWCQAELLRASEQDIAIIPVLARPIQDDDYNIMQQIRIGSLTLKDIQYRDFVGLGYDRGLEVLLSDIAGHL